MCEKNLGTKFMWEICKKFFVKNIIEKIQQVFPKLIWF